MFENNSTGTGFEHVGANPEPSPEVRAERRGKLQPWCAEVRRRLDAASGVHKRVELPDWPLEPPPWAVSTEVSFGFGKREIEVRYDGQDHRSGDAYAWITQVWLFDIDESPDDDGRDGPSDAPLIVTSELGSDELSWEQAWRRSVVLRSAARELRRHTDPLFAWDPELTDDENEVAEILADMSDGDDEYAGLRAALMDEADPPEGGE